MEHTRKAGGVVVGDGKGDWIIGFFANYRNIQVKDSPTAEAHTLKDGLDLLQRIKEGRLNLTMQRTMNEDLLKKILQLNNITIAMDSLNVVKLINGSS